MHYQKITWTLPLADIETAAAALIAAGATGLEFGAEAANKQDLTVYLDADDDQSPAQLLAYQVALAAVALPSDPSSVAVLDSADYDQVWKDYYHASRVTNRFTVVPSWERSSYQPSGQAEELIVLDPDQAFGTGTHPTTVLMIQALEAVVRGGERTIDVGTGSAVLAVAAKLLGVGPLLATDIDASAVQTAKDNLALNPVAASVPVVVSDLMADVDWPQADLVLANILADVIAPLIPQVYPRLTAGGHFLVSGIYDAVADEIEAALVTQGFILEEHFMKGEWHAFIARKD
ncbi:50S ribosomal protein L11 methyltransferase [Leuconostocaceae bacterium ESL0958]|nr:50S ribosomal protein L11 methyltransferase [Leuconostocaceae bacterium ESL0958]